MEYSGIVNTEAQLKPFRMHVDRFPLGGAHPLAARQCAQHASSEVLANAP